MMSGEFVKVSSYVELFYEEVSGNVKSPVKPSLSNRSMDLFVRSNFLKSDGVRKEPISPTAPP